jgi:hypothetical protein
MERMRKEEEEPEEPSIAAVNMAIIIPVLAGKNRIKSK